MNNQAEFPIERIAALVEAHTIHAPHGKSFNFVGFARDVAREASYSATPAQGDELPPLPEADRVLELIKSPPWGAPDLYARMHSFFKGELELAKQQGKVSEWFDAAGSLLAYFGAACRASKQGDEDARDA